MSYFLALSVNNLQKVISALYTIAPDEAANTRNLMNKNTRGQGTGWLLCIFIYIFQLFIVFFVMSVAYTNDLGRVK